MFLIHRVIAWSFWWSWWESLFPSSFLADQVSENSYHKQHSLWYVNTSFSVFQCLKLRDNPQKSTTKYFCSKELKTLCNFLFTFIFLELELARAQRLERCNHENEEKAEFEEGKRNSFLSFKKQHHLFHPFYLNHLISMNRPGCFPRGVDRRLLGRSYHSEVWISTS